MSRRGAPALPAIRYDDSLPIAAKRDEIKSPSPPTRWW